MYYDHSTFMYYDHSTCSAMITEHVSCPTGLMFGEIKGGGSGGRSPPEKQGGLGGRRPPNVKKRLHHPVNHPVVKTRDRMIWPNHRISSYHPVFVYSYDHWDHQNCPKLLEIKETRANTN